MATATFYWRHLRAPLLADHPSSRRCFPAAHAGSGYALLALYFMLREHGRRAARLGLAIGLGFGLVFGLAQQAR